MAAIAERSHLATLTGEATVARLRVTTPLPVPEGHGSPLEWLPPSSEKAAGVLPDVRAAIGPASQARIRHRGQLTTTSP
jgi:hypothetical protein